VTVKSGFALVDNDRKLIREHLHQIREALFACTTQEQVECAVGFARYLNRAGLTADNFWLFLRLVMTNNPWVIDELLHEREPKLLFSTIQPDQELIEAAFQTLFARHPEEIYTPVLEAMLGIIQNAYFDPDDGYRLRKITIMDINTLGKFLLKAEPQDHPLNRLVLEILDRLAHIGDYYGEPDKNVLSKHAFNVRYAYFDHTRDLIDAIPEPLLIRFPDRQGVHPEDDFAELVSQRRLRKRDPHGRFVKESEPVAALQSSADPVVKPLAAPPPAQPKVAATNPSAGRLKPGSASATTLGKSTKSTKSAKSTKAANTTASKGSAAQPRSKPTPSAGQPKAPKKPR